ncbi:MULTISPECIES: glutathione S-transferase family protein [unclassified Ensifer]|uniref:glutathione S-transferase family protein n=1 Tax=unclassified Ensifer TaxID=2633371 RepID=UPI000812C0BB|nr:MULTISPECIES: glutathione S-transferase family protein [unclassified Ensifer]OCP17761.1 glutathione S-transferase [Ensifer sp. LC54]OCP28333.1 glutathione S-transferase [Ensifer sp. LC384]
MKLYQGMGPNSYRVRIFMAEKGIEIPMVDVDFAKAEHRAPAFLALNSLGQIPVLELDDGTIITESVAICRYLEETQREPQLFGSDAVSRAKVEMWNRRAELVIFGTIGNVALHSDAFFKERLTQFPAFAATERQAVPRKWAWLDRELADGRPFLAGEAFSIADITAGVCAWLGDVFGMEVPGDLAHVQRWLERVRARPSFEA